MSTIRVDNFGPSAGGTTYSARGIAKAWVNFNGTGTIAARDSENVSSLTDNGTGVYAVNLANAFGAADFAVSATSANGVSFTFCSSPVETPAAGIIRLYTSGSTIALADVSTVSVLAHGDLA